MTPVKLEGMDQIIKVRAFPILGVLIGLVLSGASAATQPMNPSPEELERQRLADLKYKPKDTNYRAYLKALENLKRDCLRKDELDDSLTVESILKTFPPEIVYNVLRNNFVDICPLNFTAAIQHVRAKEGEKVKPIIRNYTILLKNPKHLPHAERLVGLFEILAQGCNPADADSFTHLYCQHRRRTGLTDQWSVEFEKIYEDKCPISENRELDCTSQ